ncbi:hypothetical protein PN480_10675 [Dolichospermum circinale CS-1225]|jgi:hypothetical protein|uniref:Type I restriction enzyme R protein N-terminal domain-containing protein n=1 Tax=Dolichospermum circinale CS-537/01 TaxID=3021739 RepID=A0ABT5A220_9CYAN|nr:hypothetical protein [Dolichospermum circinale]MDB9457824.1 hypothetical protein [Dolichospermum circinale CS-545/17]OBQ37097.1 MAG: hypothetical protein AN487_11150 [Anabaena sp. CRKS33]MDB9467298.1 hypothetical protein [Dolichospermum circinale CS-539/09]MDB9470572.1 hypothetical protein [Dolichospermum circinale CS-539]MDB9485971.1 hypothetical protein [Dolichospermum circinale CS-537/01]
MAKIKILQDNRSYTFRSYFELPYEADDILSEFDYTLIKSHLSLPQTTNPLNKLPELKQRIEDILPFISLSNETARRETLVSPILLEVIRYCHCQMRIEYPLNINNRLKGNLDYLLILKNNFLVIEAKNDDLTRGFTQLAVELIALSQIQEKSILYGAVTIGNIWQFGKLDSSEKQINQDINLFKIPGDLDSLFAVIMGILEGVEV